MQKLTSTFSVFFSLWQKFTCGKDLVQAQSKILLNSMMFPPWLCIDIKAFIISLRFSGALKILLKSYHMKNTETKRCLICGGNHLAHRCAITRQIRDRDINPPNQLCLKHCGKKTEACKDGNTDKCYIFRKQNGSLIDLTCGQSDHSLRHFL